MELPKSVRFLVIGAGVHGLSTGYHLAKELEARGEGSGEDILIVDKTGIAAGASGIACRVVRNNYFPPALAELMAAHVTGWARDPPAYHYHPVGYMALGPQAQESDLTEVASRQERIGYAHTLVTGEAACTAYMRDLFGDWRAQGITVVLHEHRGGFAFNVDSMHGIADKARAKGVRILEGVAVTGFDSDGAGAVTKVRTDQGDIEVEQVIVGVGPWGPQIWSMPGLPGA